MDSYYAEQATSVPHFSGYYRRRRKVYGALVARMGRVALPLSSLFVLTNAKSIGKELLKQSVPEVLNVVGNKKQAFKNKIQKKLLKNRLEALDELLRVGVNQYEKSLSK